MKDYFVDLTNGERLPIKVNFGTLYYLTKIPGFKTLSEKNQDEMSDDEKMDVAADVVYAILRSNGKTVTFDEALQLVPPNEEGIWYLIKGFEVELKKYNKKKRAKQMRPPSK